MLKLLFSLHKTSLTGERKIEKYIMANNTEYETELFFYKTDDISESDDDKLFIDSYIKKGALAMSFYNSGKYQGNYLLRFYSSEHSYDIPLGYGILPPANWQQDKLYTFYYYPSEDIRSWQIFAWQGENKLGYQKEIIADLELTAITEKIDL